MTDTTWDIWVNTGPSTSVGWFRITEGLAEGSAHLLDTQLTCESVVVPTGLTGPELARKLYPSLASHQFSLDTRYEDDGATAWRWLCSCDARGQWQWQSPECCRPAWTRHAVSV